VHLEPLHELGVVQRLALDQLVDLPQSGGSQGMQTLFSEPALLSNRPARYAKQASGGDPKTHLDEFIDVGLVERVLQYAAGGS
jgi:hypothetical protein